MNRWIPPKIDEHTSGLKYKGGRYKRVAERIIVSCVHCKARRGTRPRGLCWECYNDLDIRLLYKPTSPQGKRGLGISEDRGREEDKLGAGRLPSLPTLCMPGTVEKMDVMSERLSRRETLFHPLDAAGETE